MAGKWTFNPFTNNFDYYETFGSSVKYLNYLGSALTGIDGRSNRTLTFASKTARIIILDSMHLHPLSEWTQSGDTITFVGEVDNSQKITIYY